MIGGNESKDVELLDSDVMMSFTNTDSIDALMKCLKVIRRNICVTSAQNCI